MSEVVIRGHHLPVRTKVAAELIGRAAQLLSDSEDQVLLTSVAAHMSLSFDDLPPAQARRVARAVVTVADELKREFGAVGAPAAYVEVAAQMTALGMLVGAAYTDGTASD